MVIAECQFLSAGPEGFHPGKYRSVPPPGPAAGGARRMGREVGVSSVMGAVRIAGMVSRALMGVR